LEIKKNKSDGKIEEVTLHIVDSADSREKNFTFIPPNKPAQSHLGTIEWDELQIQLTDGVVDNIKLVVWGVYKGENSCTAEIKQGKTITSIRCNKITGLS